MPKSDFELGEEALDKLTECIKEKKKLIAEFLTDIYKHYNFLLNIKDFIKKWEKRTK